MSAQNENFTPKPEMRTVRRQTVRATADNGTSLSIEYTLISEHTVNGSDYGVSVALPSTGERVNIRGITTREERIDELFTLLVRNTVTPITARDVVYDWL